MRWETLFRREGGGFRGQEGSEMLHEEEGSDYVDDKRLGYVSVVKL